MDKILFPEVTDPVRRLRLIEDNCETIVDNYEYRRQFSTEEIDKMKSDLSDCLIKLQILAEKLDTIKKDYKQQMDPVTEKKLEMIKGIREGAEKVIGTCYLFKQENEIGIYSPQGVLISVPRKDQGVQKSIDLREGTNG